MDENIESLCASWLEAKKVEAEAAKERRALEDQLAKALNVNETQEGSSTISGERYKVKVTTRFNRKVDSDKVQDIAADNGLSHLLPTLFRWKPEISISAWKNTDQALTRPLLDAIETKPGRPSFSIEEI